MAAKFSRHAKKDPSIRRKHINAFIDSRSKICPFCRKSGYAVFQREEWINGWDGDEVYTYYCRNCHHISYECVESPSNQLFHQ